MYWKASKDITSIMTWKKVPVLVTMSAVTKHFDLSAREVLAHSSDALQSALQK